MATWAAFLLAATQSRLGLIATTFNPTDPFTWFGALGVAGAIAATIEIMRREILLVGPTTRRHEQEMQDVHAKEIVQLNQLHALELMVARQEAQTWREQCQAANAERDRLREKWDGLAPVLSEANRTLAWHLQMAEEGRLRKERPS